MVSYSILKYMKKGNVKIVLIAGPSSSGKTTTTRWIYYLLEIISNFEEYAFADYKNALRHVVNKLDAIRREVGFYSDMDKMPNISRLRSRIMNLQNESQDEIAAFTLLFEEATIKLAEVLKTYFDSPKDLSRKQRLLANLDIFGGKETFDSEVFVSAMLAQINECYDKAKTIIEKNRDLLDLIANSLIEHETLTKEQIDYLAENGKMPEEDMLDDVTLPKLKEMAKEKKIKGYSSMTKEELKKALSEALKEENE